MADAICVKCGASKPRPFSRCPTCEFDPSGDDESLVRSVYLSAGRFDDERAADAYRRELDSLGAVLRAGKTIAFDPDELMRLRMQKAAVGGIPPSAVWEAILLKLFLPAALFVGALLGLGYLLRSLR